MSLGSASVAAGVWPAFDAVSYVAQTGEVAVVSPDMVTMACYRMGFCCLHSFLFKHIIKLKSLKKSLKQSCDSSLQALGPSGWLFVGLKSFPGGHQ